MATIVNKAINLLSGTLGGIHLYKPEKNLLEWTTSKHPIQTGFTLQRGEGLAGKVWDTKKTIIINDYSHWENRVDALKSFNPKASIGVPIQWDNKFLGVIIISSKKISSFSEKDAELLNLLASQAAVAIHNAHLFDAERQARKEAQTLQIATQAISSSLNLSDVLNTIITELQKVVPYDSCSVLKIDETHVEIIAGAGFLNWDEIKGLRFLLGDEVDNPSSSVVRTHQPFIVDDVSIYPSFQQEEVSQEKTTSWLGVPLIIEKEVVGVIAIDKHKKAFFNKHHANIAESFATQAALAMKNAELFAAAEESRLDAEKANQAKSIFLANMSHELRTPMNAILGFTQILEKDENLSPHQRENLNIIGRSGDHLLNLISEILEISKIEAGRATLSLDHFDLYLLLDTIEAMFQLRAREKGLLLTIERDPELQQYIYADEGKIRQVLINLLGNAVKFTSKGIITLRVKCLYSIGKITFEVQDTGEGISLEEQDKLFQPFYQTSSGRSAKAGTGLGLSIAREYARLMGGDLVIADTPDGKGTLFIFTAEVDKTEASLISTLEPRGKVLGLEAGQPVYRILIVEDNLDNQAVLTEILSISGLETRIAENGQEGVEMSKNWQPDLIFMDIQMPVMDGYEATTLIKETGNIPIIALTAAAFEHDRKTMLASGFDDLVIKPLRTEHILELLEQYIHVKFIYANTDRGATKERDRLTPSDLQHLSENLIERLNLAAELVNRKEIYAIIKEITPLDENLASSLSALVDDFQFDILIELTEKNSE